MAKVYNCPTCNAEFTTALIKKNDQRCPSCNTPLKHDMQRRNGGSMEHGWAIDDERQAPQPEQGEIAGSKYKVISPDDNPEIFRLIGTNPGGEMDFQVVYRDKFAQTRLRCLVCGTYLHTTSTISGGVEEVYCRANAPNKDGVWEKKCKTRTRYIFLRRGEAHEINV